MDDIRRPERPAEIGHLAINPRGIGTEYRAGAAGPGRQVSRGGIPDPGTRGEVEIGTTVFGNRPRIMGIYQTIKGNSRGRHTAKPQADTGQNTLIHSVLPVRYC